MPEPTTTWFCNRCGQLIELAEHGWVEWVHRDKPRRGEKPCRNIRIVHGEGYGPCPEGCRFDGLREHRLDGGGVGAFSLTEFLGHDGLMRLLEMIVEDEHPIDDLLEIIKRIHTPGYEHARRHFDQALRAGVIDLSVTPGFWWQDDIQRVLDFASSRDVASNE